MNAELTGVDRTMVQADIMVPTQFFAQLHGRAALHHGECRLLVAVLEDAVRRFQRHADARDLRGQRMFREVEQWLTDRGPGGDGALSFEYICAVLGLDPDYLRDGLREWRRARAG